MRFALLALPAALFAGLASAAATAEKRQTDPTNPQNLINCPPGGGADACHLETSCNRIRINYGWALNGHYIWYNNNPDDVPDGKRIEIDNEGTC
ncbi:uncharacterized protein SCHCODRAFT_02483119 [Schizophyllum commune H4-8]|nr:uncharacterized protein SCHCODRAFT_02483119 [Schizophyllum commune H4-8]KAI5899726.1 hypothetical protein SCHCODRAFT_02483119 [Schizophyllum commune H4-8]